jgi:hypothetical protein
MLASFIAALVSGPVFAWLGNIIFPPPQVMVDPLWVIIFVLPAYIQIITYPVSIVGMLVIGIPYHALVRKMFGDQYLLIGLSGGPLVLLSAAGLSTSGSIDQFSWLYVACGAAVSATYALLSKQFNKSKLSGAAKAAASD